MRISGWSSDVCSSDLAVFHGTGLLAAHDAEGDRLRAGRGVDVDAGCHHGDPHAALHRLVEGGAADDVGLRLDLVADAVGRLVDLAAGAVPAAADVDADAACALHRHLVTPPSGDGA